MIDFVPRQPAAGKPPEVAEVVSDTRSICRAGRPARSSP